jgi:hypothetical protein
VNAASPARPPGLAASVLQLYALEARHGALRVALVCMVAFAAAMLAQVFRNRDETYNFVPAALLVVVAPNVWGVASAYLGLAAEYASQRHVLWRALPCTAHAVVIARFSWTVSSTWLGLLFIVCGIHWTHPSEAHGVFSNGALGWLSWWPVALCWAYAGAVGIAAAVSERGHGALAAVLVLLTGTLAFLFMVWQASLKPTLLPTLPVPGFMYGGAMPISFPILSTLLAILWLRFAGTQLERQDA